MYCYGMSCDLHVLLWDVACIAMGCRVTCMYCYGVLCDLHMLLSMGYGMFCYGVLCGNLVLKNVNIIF